MQIAVPQRHDACNPRLELLNPQQNLSFVLQEPRGLFILMAELQDDGGMPRDVGILGPPDFAEAAHAQEFDQPPILEAGGALAD